MTNVVGRLGRSRLGAARPSLPALLLLAAAAAACATVLVLRQGAVQRARGRAVSRWGPRLPRDATAAAGEVLGCPRGGDGGDFLPASRRANETLARGSSSSSSSAAAAAARVSVLALEVDAVSRAQFEREMRATAEALGANASGTHHAFAFSHFNAVGADAAENFAAVYAGFRWTRRTRQFHDVADRWSWGWRAGGVSRNMTRGAEGGGGLPDGWVWSEARRRGLLTLHGEEACDGRADATFFGPAAAPAGADVVAPCLVQRRGASLCVGAHPSFVRSLEYLLEFQRQHEDAALFATWHVYLSEPSRQLGLLDAPLAAFARETLRAAAAVVLVLYSANGPGGGPGPAPTTYEAQREHKNPPLLVAAPRRLLERHPEAARALEANRDRLVTSFDLYRTLVSAPEFPHTAAGPPWAVNLLGGEVIAPDRSCSQARVPPGYCATPGRARAEYMEVGSRKAAGLLRVALEAAVDADACAGGGVLVRALERVERSRLRVAAADQRWYDVYELAVSLHRHAAAVSESYARWVLTAEVVEERPAGRAEWGGDGEDALASATVARVEWARGRAPPCAIQSG